MSESIPEPPTHARGSSLVRRIFDETVRAFDEKLFKLAPFIREHEELVRARQETLKAMVRLGLVSPEEVFGAAGKDGKPKRGSAPKSGGHGRRETSETQERRARILTFLLNSGKSHSGSQIAEAIGMETKTVSNDLQRLHRKGRVSKVGWGQWKHPDHVEDLDQVKPPTEPGSSLSSNGSPGSEDRRSPLANQ